MTIPRYDESHTQRAPLPSVRVPTDVPRESVGVAPHVNFQGLTSALDEAWQKEKAKADQIAVTGADAKAAALETQIMYDPQRGVLQMKGRDALQSRDAMDEEWAKGMNEITKDLHNDTQRLAFQRSVNTRIASMHNTISKHIVSEIEAYDDQQTQSLIVNEANAATAAAVKGSTLDAIADRSTMAIGRQRAALMDYSQRKGLSNERTDELLAQTTSKTHAQVIERVLANEEDITAKRYYEEFKDQLVGQDLVNATKAIETGSLRGESQRKADDIFAKNMSDQQKAMDEVKKISDPQLRDAVETRVIHSFELQKSIQREKENDLYQEATNIIEPMVRRLTPFVASSVVPSNIWSQLPLGARNALERRAQHADSDFPNNPGVWHNFLDLTPSEMGQLNKLEFETKYWSHFDRETRTRSEFMWAQARDAERTGKHDAKQSADLTFKDIMNKAVRGIDQVFYKKQPKDWTPTQEKFYNDFTIEAMRRKETAEIAKGKPLTGTEMNEIMDGLVHQRVFIDKRMGRDPYMLPGEVSRDQRGRAYVPLENIPDKERNEITSMAKGANRRKIERLYAARLMNDPALFRQILQEK